MNQSDALTVNVREILHSKAPNTKVPGFLVKYLEKIAHQDEINQFLKEKGHLYGIDFVEASMRLLDLTIHTEGLDQIPEGRYTFAGTHPLGGIDGLSTGFAIHNRFPEQSIKFLSNDLLSSLKNLMPLFIPVNKVGSQSQHRSLPERLNEAYQSEKQMVIFPAGKCSRRVKGKITEMHWTKSFITKSIETQRNVVPVYFEGRNSNFFYNFGNLRTFLGIKTNLEMLYLANEMFKQRGNTFRIIFGKPIPYTTFDSSRTNQQWADWVREQSLLLAKSIK
ncbi:MAG: glycerol acyltransferase [Bacteroidales bacterium]|nr:glycerol acyltransferase [Bacteroidales bacterium]